MSTPPIRFLQHFSSLFTPPFLVYTPFCKCHQLEVGEDIAHVSKSLGEHCVRLLTSEIHLMHQLGFLLIECFCLFVSFMAEQGHPSDCLQLRPCFNAKNTLGDITLSDVCLQSLVFCKLYIKVNKETLHRKSSSRVYGARSAKTMQQLMSQNKMSKIPFTSFSTCCNDV